jgi:epoxyqueuosine reductase
MADSHTPQGTLEKLRLEAARFGVDVVSSARIGPAEKERFHASIREVAASLDRAIVLGCRLSGDVLATIEGAPNWTYYYHYRTVNFALDQAALFCATECRRMGYRAFPVPASQMMDWDRLLGHLSHRELGALAGIGWRGRNNLLVHPEFGSQVRYASVLTDAPLPDRGLALDAAAGCGDCRECVGVCPAGAIKMDPLKFDLDRCAAQVRRFSKSEKLNTLICGICVKACGGASTAAAAAGAEQAGGCA